MLCCNQIIFSIYDFLMHPTFHVSNLVSPPVAATNAKKAPLSKQQSISHTFLVRSHAPLFAHCTAIWMCVCHKFAPANNSINMGRAAAEETCNTQASLSSATGPAGWRMEHSQG